MKIFTATVLAAIIGSSSHFQAKANLIRGMNANPTDADEEFSHGRDMFEADVERRCPEEIQAVAGCYATDGANLKGCLACKLNMLENKVKEGMNTCEDLEALLLEEHVRCAEEGHCDSNCDEQTKSLEDCAFAPMCANAGPGEDVVNIEIA